MTPLGLVVLIAAGVGLVAWIVSLVTGDCSQIDRLWSILPVVYVWVFAGFARLGNARLDAMAAIVTIWGARLTYNLARKGGYRGMEDYRWAVLRARMKPWQFQVFNLLFVVIYQSALLVLISLPALTAYQHRTTPFGAADAALVALFLGCTYGETVADQQQWDFHRHKKRELVEGRAPEPRFLQTGLFRWSRHPNYFFEQAQWWLLFLIGALAAGTVVQWTLIGPFLLTLLFVGSTRMTEGITLSKYPEYAVYQARTSAVIPWPPRRTAAESPS